MGGASDAVKARLAGQHLHNHELVGGGLCENHFHVGDFERRQAAADGLCGGEGAGGHCATRGENA